jgi:hypothetical protein
MTVGRPRMTTATRLRRYLQILECRYPRAWEHLERLRDTRARLEPWPAWCYVPLATAYDVVSPDGPTRDSTRLVDVAIVGGLAAWRASQDICQVDHGELCLERSLRHDLDLDFAPAHLQMLLDRAIYIELPPTSLGSPATGATRGAFVHLEYDPRSRVSELRLLIEPSRRWTLGSVPLIPVVVPLTEPTLARCLESTVRNNVRRFDRLDRFAVAGEMAVALHGLARVFLGLLVHLLDPARAVPEPAELSDPPRHADADALAVAVIAAPAR